MNTKKTVWSGPCKVVLVPGWDIRLFEFGEAPFLRFTVFPPDGLPYRKLYVYDHRPESIEAECGGNEEELRRAINRPAKVVVAKRVDTGEVFVKLHPYQGPEPEAMLMGLAIRGDMLPCQVEKAYWTWTASCVPTRGLDCLLVSITDRIHRLVTKDDGTGTVLAISTSVEARSSELAA